MKKRLSECCRYPVRKHCVCGEHHWTMREAIEAIAEGNAWRRQKLK